MCALHGADIPHAIHNYIWKLPKPGLGHDRRRSSVEETPSLASFDQRSKIRVSASLTGPVPASWKEKLRLDGIQRVAASLTEAIFRPGLTASPFGHLAGRAALYDGTLFAHAPVMDGKPRREGTSLLLERAVPDADVLQRAA